MTETTTLTPTDPTTTTASTDVTTTTASTPATTDAVDTSSRAQPANAASSLVLVPAVDLTEDATGVTLVADVPGASREALQIDVDGDTLTLDAPFTLSDAANAEAAYAEVQARRYHRSFTLSRDLDTSRIEATLKDGVLNLRVPKQVKALPRRIEVLAA